MATFSRGRSRWLPVLASALLVAAVGIGCSGKPWVNPPEELLDRPWQNLNPPTPDTYPDPAQVTTAGLDAAFGNNPNPTPRPPQTETRPLNVLALSGGGKYASYSAGVVCGWTQSGTRPTFDVVTGISSGALLAVYAFLGPQYDKKVEDLFVNISRKDLFKLKPFTGPFTSGSLASTEPFAKLIEREVSDAVVAEIAKGHCEGRRLFVATGNRTTLRVAIWDVGAVAASGRPDAARLVRKILLASSSHPGFAPAVEFDVTVNGTHYCELHGDGGNLIQAFVRTGNGLPPNSNVYVVTAGKFYRDVQNKKPSMISTITTAASNTLYSLYRADVMNIYTQCAVSHSQFRIIATPPNVMVTAGSLSFDKEDQRRLFDVGARQAATPTSWRTTPPGTQPDETLTPRAGVEFFVPQP